MPMIRHHHVPSPRRRLVPAVGLVPARDDGPALGDGPTPPPLVVTTPPGSPAAEPTAFAPADGALTPERPAGVLSGSVGDLPAPAALRTCVDRSADAGACRGVAMSGARVGVVGYLCHAHYSRRNRKLARAAAIARGVPPCAACGTDGGYTRPGTAVPVRYRVRREGVGKLTGRHAVASDRRICHACKVAADLAADAATAGRPCVRVEPLAPDPGPKEIARLAREVRRDRSPDGFATLVEPRYEGGGERAAATAARREAARLAIREGLAREADRAGWTGPGAIVVPAPRLEEEPARPAEVAGWRASRFRYRPGKFHKPEMRYD